MERYSVDWKANCVLQKRHFDRKKVEPQLGDDMKFNRDDEHVKSWDLLGWDLWTLNKKKNISHWKMLLKGVEEINLGY